MSRWRALAEDTIGRVIRAGLAAKACSSEIRKQVDEAYPFGEREYHPYKIWLDVRRQMFAFHGLATEAEMARRAKTCGSPRPDTFLAAVDAARRDGLIR